MKRTPIKRKTPLVPGTLRGITNADLPAGITLRKPRATTIKASGKRKDGCGCETCRPITMSDMRMVLCEICGNKRCPRATDHRNACTNSNEVGQSGSSWANVKPISSRKRMKTSRPKMTLARANARGQDCTIRIPGVCNGNPETTVLAHYRLAGYCGTGIKPDDTVFGAWACIACHDLCDGRSTSNEWSRDGIRLMHAEGVMRTQEAIRGGA